MSIVKLGEAGASGSVSGNADLGVDFPIICEKCLGPNPYVRMLRTEMGRQCRISGHPFAGFRWVGEHKRWKETMIAPAVAREKNVCQSCICDLEYGVPFHVRDHIMEALGTEDIPKSDVSKEYYWANKKQKQMDDAMTGGQTVDTYGKLKEQVEKLRSFAELDPGPVLRPKRETPLTPEEQVLRALRPSPCWPRGTGWAGVRGAVRVGVRGTGWVGVRGAAGGAGRGGMGTAPEKMNSPFDAVMNRTGPARLTRKEDLS